MSLVSRDSNIQAGHPQHLLDHSGYVGFIGHSYSIRRFLTHENPYGEKRWFLNHNPPIHHQHQHVSKFFIAFLHPNHLESLHGLATEENAEEHIHPTPDLPVGQSVSSMIFQGKTSMLFKDFPANHVWFPQVTCKIVDEAYKSKTYIEREWCVALHWKIRAVVEK